jgi:hypothetical protein
MIDGEGGHPNPTRYLVGAQCRSGILTCMSRTVDRGRDDEASRWHGPAGT